jgi:hypothetical protein
MNKRFFGITALAFSLYASAAAQTVLYQYDNRFGTNEIRDSLIVIKTNEGYIAEMVQLDMNTNGAKSIVLMDNSFNTLRWEMTAASNNTRVISVLENHTIHVTGMLKGKPVDKTFTMDPLPWFQEWQTGCVELIKQGKKEFYFYSIDPDINVLTKFKGAYLKDETIIINNKKVDALHYKIGLDGLFSALMDGNFWYNKNTGNYIKSEIKFIFNNTTMTRNLISESSN